MSTLQNPLVANDTDETDGIQDIAMLSTWSKYDWSDEINLDQLSKLDQIVVTTQNHTYEIVVVSPETGDVLVRGGGTRWPEFIAARLAGSTLGGGFLKVRGLNLGFRLELVIGNGRSILTSPMRTVRVIRGVEDSPDRGIFNAAAPSTHA
jgi:hypothetical protein